MSKPGRTMAEIRGLCLWAMLKGDQSGTAIAKRCALPARESCAITSALYDLERMGLARRQYIEDGTFRWLVVQRAAAKSYIDDTRKAQPPKLPDRNDRHEPSYVVLAASWEGLALDGTVERYPAGTRCRVMSDSELQGLEQRRTEPGRPHTGWRSRVRRWTAAGTYPDPEVCVSLGGRPRFVPRHELERAC